MDMNSPTWIREETIDHGHIAEVGVRKLEAHIALVKELNPGRYATHLMPAIESAVQGHLEMLRESMAMKYEARLEANDRAVESAAAVYDSTLALRVLSAGFASPHLSQKAAEHGGRVYEGFMREVEEIGDREIRQSGALLAGLLQLYTSLAQSGSAAAAGVLSSLLPPHQQERLGHGRGFGTPGTNGSGSGERFG